MVLEHKNTKSQGKPRFSLFQKAFNNAGMVSILYYLYSKMGI